MSSIVMPLSDAMEMCSLRRCLAMAASVRSTILAFSRHVTIPLGHYTAIKAHIYTIFQ
jgi:hypothetical protein